MQIQAQTLATFAQHSTSLFTQPGVCYQQKKKKEWNRFCTQKTRILRALPAVIHIPTSPPRNARDYAKSTFSARCLSRFFTKSRTPPRRRRYLQVTHAFERYPRPPPPSTTSTGGWMANNPYHPTMKAKSRVVDVVVVGAAKGKIKNAVYVCRKIMSF